MFGFDMYNLIGCFITAVEDKSILNVKCTVVITFLFIKSIFVKHESNNNNNNKLIVMFMIIMIIIINVELKCF